MSNRWLFILAGVGLVLGISGAVYFSRAVLPQPPAFRPAENPYAHGLFANGIIETSQAAGENINIYPEVAGRVTEVFVSEGQQVAAGAPLMAIDASVQQAVVAQLKATAQAAKTALEQLQKQPRPEVLEVSRAQVDAAQASYDQASDQYQKRKRAVDIDKRSLSQDVVDTSLDAMKIAQRNLELARKQYELTKAGAWTYDIEAQESTYRAALRQYESANALLEKYTLRATVDGSILRISAAVGSYVSPSGTYDAYTQGTVPVLAMGRGVDQLAVRVFVDEILLQQLADPGHLVGQMQLRGTQITVPLEFVRIQPYVSPKVELSNDRTEQVDLRVLPVIFKFTAPPGLKVFPGQLVDVYIGSK
jgi:HlyD family secretion protein